jgi:hypothetical protein
MVHGRRPHVTGRQRDSTRGRWGRRRASTGEGAESRLAARKASRVPPRPPEAAEPAAEWRASETQAPVVRPGRHLSRTQNHLSQSLLDHRPRRLAPESHRSAYFAARWLRARMRRRMFPGVSPRCVHRDLKRYRAPDGLGCSKPDTKRTLLTSGCHALSGANSCVRYRTASLGGLRYRDATARSIAFARAYVGPDRCVVFQPAGLTNAKRANVGRQDSHHQGSSEQTLAVTFARLMSVLD